MTTEDYYLDRVALPGSSLYYSVLFAPPDLRTALTAVHALAAELGEIAQGRGDASIARARLAWWAEELARAADGGARHPVTRALEEPLAGVRFDPARFAAVLSAAEAHVSRDAYGALAELEDHLRRMADLTGCLAAELAGFRDPRTPERSRSLGVGLALTELVRAPRRPGEGRVTDMPLETLAAQGVEPGELLGARTSDALRAALGTIAERARAHLADYLDGLPVEDRAAQRHRRALAEMTLAQLGAMGRARFPVLERPVGVTPLRKLWIAWKHRHQ